MKRIRFSILQKVISGGQTGADRAALEAARDCGIGTGGYAPRGYLTCAGPDSSLQSLFGLEQLTIPNVSVAQMFALRSQRNVDASNATVAFRLTNSVGTDKTIGFCLTKRWKSVPRNQWTVAAQHRPVLVIADFSSMERVVQRIIAFVRRVRPRVLNFCGHRSDASAGIEGYSRLVKEALTLAFQELQKDNE